MAGFKVVESPHEPLWMPVNNNSTVYIGQLVQFQGSSTGVEPMGAANNASDTTGKKIPFGVVVGINDMTPTYNNTYGQYVTGVNTMAAQAARSYAMAEGMWSKGDPQVLVQIVRITPDTVLEGKIYNAANGTSLTVFTAGANSTDGSNITVSGTPQCTPVAYNSLVYCRSGLNSGIYRIPTVFTAGNNAADVITFGRAFPRPITTGDTFVVSNVGIGVQRLQIDANGTYIDGEAALTTHYYYATVYSVDLRESGKEVIRFSFNGDSFCAARA